LAREDGNMTEDMDKAEEASGITQFVKDGANFNFWSSLGFIAFSLFLLISIPYQIEKPRLIMGRSLTGLDPALFPRVAAAGMLLLSIAYLSQSRKLKEENSFRGVALSGYVNVAVTILVLSAYALLLEPIGFVASSALTVAVLTVLYGNRNIYLIGLSSLGIPLAIYYMCTRLLLVFLPEFPLL
jgi:putative tricarboxylic transport membrane protein